jgi:ERCC4-type nuclease
VITAGSGQEPLTIEDTVRYVLRVNDGPCLVLLSGPSKEAERRGSVVTIFPVAIAATIPVVSGQSILSWPHQSTIQETLFANGVCSIPVKNCASTDTCYKTITYTTNPSFLIVEPAKSAEGVYAESLLRVGEHGMLYVDNRAGSKELYPLLRARGLPVTLTRMDYGDVSFLGSGPDGQPVAVGIEVKGIHDVLKCIADGRFAGHQLPGLVQAYDQVWLLIEGLWRSNAKTGMLEYRHSKGQWRECTAGTRRFMYSDLLTWLFTCSVKGGIQFFRASDWGEATVWLSALYNWWTVKGWEGHKSHLAFHDGTRFGAPYKRDRATMMVASLADRALLQRPTLCRMVSAQLPSIGWEKSKAISDKFKTVEQLVLSTREELMALDGIGPKLANGIWESLRGVK